MAVTFRREHDNVYLLEIAGLLRKRDLDEVQRLLEPGLSSGARIRLLVRLKDFDGWEESENWRDLGFYIRYGDAIERMAIVGDERWRGEAMMFAAADLRTGLVEFFPADRAHEAWRWLEWDMTRSSTGQPVR